MINMSSISIIKRNKLLEDRKEDYSNNGKMTVSGSDKRYDHCVFYSILNF